ncbi:FixH family protein [Sulfuricystis multivorans]|uniref:FixH family protein n=1 Tax=Sulfuricystis multivorans TaxID=2211108 RepID=UPI000F8345EE|nr:FixH family protein [Sulfuricystis multivorans]
MNAPTRQPTVKPWYREPWPWFLMSGPIIVIIAAFVSAWIAIRSNDGLVSEDYYKQGLAAGETLAKSKLAETLGITVAMRLEGDRVRVRLGSRDASVSPTALYLTLSHPTRAGIDQHAILKPLGAEYVGELNLPASGHWLLIIEDEAKTWRVMGGVMLPASNDVVIGASGKG